MIDSETLAGRLARYSQNLSDTNIPPEVIHEVKRRLIDTFACALGGWDRPPVQIARKVAESVPLVDAASIHGATVLGSEIKTSPELAAFVNGTAIRVLDFNDTYLSKEPAHPSDNISTALAAAETEGCGGEEVILAILIGYEIQCRLCDAAALRPRGWDHVTYGSFSTTLVAARLWRLSEEKTVHALGLAGTANNALRQTRVGALSMWKGVAFANAARNGLFAAKLARFGMTGPAPVFEGEKGFMKTVSGPFDLPALHPEGPFKIMETYIKYYPVEYHAQSAVYAALALRKTLSNEMIDGIQSIQVRTSDVSHEIIGRDPEKWRPETRETADHSLPYCVAVALRDGEMGLEQFNAAHLNDPALHRLIQRVKIKADPSLSATYPEAIANIVEIRCPQNVFTKRVDYPLGHPRNPMTDQAVEEKFYRLAGPLLSAKKIREILDRLWCFEEEKSIVNFLSLFKKLEKAS